MKKIDFIVLSMTEPADKNTIWAYPVGDGLVSLRVFNNGEWMSTDKVADLTPYLKKEDAQTLYLLKSDAQEIYATNEALDLKQDKTDNTLDTEDKTIVGAINELASKPSGVGRVDPNSSRGTGEIFNSYVDDDNRFDDIDINVASGDYSHAEGSRTEATGRMSHAEGNATTASGFCSHAEGYFSEATGGSSHAEGSFTEASGDYSHVEGYYTTAQNSYEHAEGSNNVSNTGDTEDLQTRHSVGIGTSNTDHKNAHEIMVNGDHYIYGLGGYDGTNIENAQTLQEVINSKQETITAGTGLEFEGNTLNVTLDTTVFKVVSVLPDSPAQGDENKIHLVPAESTGANNAYTEYIWVNSAWEILGEYTSEVDLTPYLKIEDASETYATKTELQEVQTSVNGKQDTLVSGQNIKTLDGESLLGEGDIQIRYPMASTTPDSRFPDMSIKLNQEGQPDSDYDETLDTIAQKLHKGVDWIYMYPNTYLIYDISWSDHYYWIYAVNPHDPNDILEIAFSVSGMTTQHRNLKNFQTTKDETLTTTDKTVPGAINELKTSIDNNSSKLPAYTVVPTLTGNYSIPVNSTTQEKIYQIAIGSTVYGVYGADGIIWQNGIDPVVEANCTIVVSVINNLAVWGKFRNE